MSFGTFRGRVMRRFQITCLLLAWFAATGAQWDFVQVYGWARMFAKYAQTMPLATAMKKTFDGEMCGVCQLVKEAKQDADPAGVPSGKIDLKLPLVFEPTPAIVLAAPEPAAWRVGEARVPSYGRAPPLLTPPRV